MNDTVYYYVITPTHILGPYTNKVIAESAKLTLPLEEQPLATIEGKTADGKSILLG